MNTKLAFLFVLHQPYYFSKKQDLFLLPYARLFLTKDYVKILEKFSEWELPINISISAALLKQLKTYDLEKDYFFKIAETNFKDLNNYQIQLIKKKFTNFIPKWAKVKYHKVKLFKNTAELSNYDLEQLKILFNLFWIYPSFINKNNQLKEIFTSENIGKKQLIIIKEAINTLFKTFFNLLEKNSVNIIPTSFSFAVLPLLLNLKAYIPKESANIPDYKFKDDVIFQINESIKYLKQNFENVSNGFFLPFFGVNKEILKILSENNINWTIIAEKLFLKSIYGKSDSITLKMRNIIYNPYKFGDLKLLIHDKILSDMITFIYANVEPKKAAFDFIKRIENIEKLKKDPFILVVIDDFTGFSFYEDDSETFWEELLSMLKVSKNIEVVNIDNFLNNQNLQLKNIDNIVAGTCFDENFNLFISSENRIKMWQNLYEVRKKCFNENIALAQDGNWFLFAGKDFYNEDLITTNEIFKELLEVNNE